MKDIDSIHSFLAKVDDISLTPIRGRITEAVGMLIRAIIPHVRLGELCMIKRDPLPPLMAEVVGFTKEEAILSPLGEMNGLSPASEVIPMRMPVSIGVGPNLLGRVLNALGEPLDVDKKGPLILHDRAPIVRSPPDPLQRQKITEPLATGVRAIDGLLTVGKGQRVGIFAGAGVGKSTLLSMIARSARADINVIALIGERGREVLEFIENDLGEEGLKRSVVVVSTSDQPAQMRLNAAYAATAVAEYFRDYDGGRSVILMMDSVTRFARALREIGLAAGEPPARAGYTPSVFSTLPKLMERAGASSKGFITAFYTVLMAGADDKEPVSDETKSILDGHIYLSPAKAAANHYPAIDINVSASRLQTKIVTADHLKAAGVLRNVLASYAKIETLLRVGEYKPGSDREADFAIKHIEKVNRFLRQSTTEPFAMAETVRQLSALF